MLLEMSSMTVGERRPRNFFDADELKLKSMRILRARSRPAHANALRQFGACRVLGLLASTTILVVLPVPAAAMPSGPELFCGVYVDAPGCAQRVRCSLCHTSAPARNAYGADIAAKLLPRHSRPLSSAEYRDNLEAALRAVEALDSDGDGDTNLEEIEAGTLPGDPTSTPSAGGCGRNNEQFNVCDYDLPYAYKKVKLDFCGASPTFEELDQFRSLDQQEQLARLDQVLDGCLESAFWRGPDGQLWQLAHPKIRPVASLKDGVNKGPIPLADYESAYNLFVYANTGERDVRDVLLADYFVERQGETYRAVEETALEGMQKARRAGIITTRWFLVINTMFTALPRLTASQTYRAFLGLDIAKLEGLYPVEGEPVDYDGKGVRRPACARCHSTLDPLSYVFRNYNGLTGGKPYRAIYVPDRLELAFQGEGPRIGETPEAGVIFGEPVADLRAWAAVAANSDAFAEKTVLDYWRLLLGREPNGDEQSEFSQLWRDLRGRHDYRVERMLHDLVKTRAYGVP
jgi:hypothetical protein